MKRLLAVFVTALSIAAFAIQPAAAANTCSVTVSGNTWYLNASCTTDSTWLIPSGVTLNGQDYTVTGVDPSGGHFLGAVIQATPGGTLNVTNLTVTVSGLANACDGGDARLRGILFNSASGSVTNSNFLNINQGESGCQEGNAIEVRNAPFDGTHPHMVYVTVSGNTISGYQKTGIVANGDVNVQAYGNTVVGLGKVGYIAQNGIQFGYGATGMVHDNVISGNYYTGADWTSAAILMFDVSRPDLKTSSNTFASDNQLNLDLTTDAACQHMYHGFYENYGIC